MKYTLSIEAEFRVPEDWQGVPWVRESIIDQLRGALHYLLSEENEYELGLTDLRFGALLPVAERPRSDQ